MDFFVQFQTEHSARISNVSTVQPMKGQIKFRPSCLANPEASKDDIIFVDYFFTSAMWKGLQRKVAFKYRGTIVIALDLKVFSSEKLLLWPNLSKGPLNGFRLN